MPTTKLDRALKRVNFLPLATAQLRRFAQQQPIMTDGQLTTAQIEALLRMLDTHYHYVARETTQKICAEKEVWSDADQCFYDLKRG